MGFVEISVTSAIMVEISEEVNAQSLTTPYHRCDINAHISDNYGSTRDALTEITHSTEISANCTRQLMECTGRFLANAAEIFDETDYAIAQEVANS